MQVTFGARARLRRVESLLFRAANAEKVDDVDDPTDVEGEHFGDAFLIGVERPSFQAHNAVFDAHVHVGDIELGTHQDFAHVFVNARVVSLPVGRSVTTLAFCLRGPLWLNDRRPELHDFEPAMWLVEKFSIGGDGHALAAEALVHAASDR